MIARFQAAGLRLHAAARRTLERTDLDALSDRLRRGSEIALRQRAARLDALERQLRSVGPLAVLERGFSVTSLPDGRIVRFPSDVRPGDEITTRLADGSIGSVVQGGPARPAPLHQPKARSERPAPDQLGLFAPGQDPTG